MIGYKDSGYMEMVSLLTFVPHPRSSLRMRHSAPMARETGTLASARPGKRRGCAAGSRC